MYDTLGDSARIDHMPKKQLRLPLLRWIKFRIHQSTMHKNGIRFWDHSYTLLYANQHNQYHNIRYALKSSNAPALLNLGKYDTET